MKSWINSNNNKGDNFDHKPLKCHREIVLKTSRLTSVYSGGVLSCNHLPRKHKYDRDELLFDKVTRQLNEYLVKRKGNCKSVIVNHSTPDEQSSGKKPPQLASWGLSKPSRQFIFKQILMSNLNNQEKELLKSFLQNETKSQSNRHVFLPEIFQKHLLEFLVQIASKIGLKRDLLERVRKCPVVHELKRLEDVSRSPIEISHCFCKPIIEYCSVKCSVSVRPDCSQVPVIRCGQIIFQWKIRTDRVKLNGFPNSQFCTIINQLIIDCDVLRFTNNSLIQFIDPSDLSSFRPTVQPFADDDNSNHRQSVSTRSALVVLKVDLIYYSLEYSENHELSCCQEDIYFSYQPNYYNHLLHLCLSLKDQHS